MTHRIQQWDTMTVAELHQAMHTPKRSLKEACPETVQAAQALVDAKLDFYGTWVRFVEDAEKEDRRIKNQH